MTSCQRLIPLRAIRKLANTALQRMSALFDTLHADTDRTSIAPEKLMRAQLLQLFYSLRSERMLMEQLGYSRSAVCSMLSPSTPAAPLLALTRFHARCRFPLARARYSSPCPVLSVSPRGRSASSLTERIMASPLIACARPTFW